METTAVFFSYPIELKKVSQGNSLEFMNRTNWRFEKKTPNNFNYGLFQ